MAKPPRDRSLTDSRTYFISAGTWEGRSVFQSERLAPLFLDMLFQYRGSGKFLLHEFVVMPTHIHLLLTAPPETTLERAMQFIKGGFSHRAGEEVGRNKEIWQRGYVDHRIRDATDYVRHVEYIRQNPVRAGMVQSPELYPYCSAYPGFVLDPPPQGLKPQKK
ncbi:MAG: REP-associated tyrosine transposase [Gammaproteobacteria bacterium]